MRELYNNNLHPDDRQIFRDFATDNYPDINTEWTEKDIEFLVVIDIKTKCIVGLLVMIPYEDDKVHIRLMVVDKEYRKLGIGTKMLTHVAAKYVNNKVTLNVAFDRLDLIEFYCGKNYAKLEEVSDEHKVVILSLIHLNLFAKVPLPQTSLPLT